MVNAHTVLGIGGAALPPIKQNLRMDFSSLEEWPLVKNAELAGWARTGLMLCEIIGSKTSFSTRRISPLLPFVPGAANWRNEPMADIENSKAFRTGERSARKSRPKCRRSSEHNCYRFDSSLRTTKRCAAFKCKTQFLLLEGIPNVHFCYTYATNGPAQDQHHSLRARF